MIDGSGMLHSSVYWSKEDCAEDLVNNIEHHLSKLINAPDAYLLFDCYKIA